MEDRLRVVEDPEPVGPDGEPGGEVSEHRAEAGPLEDRYRHHRGGEQHDDRDDIEAVGCGMSRGFGGVGRLLHARTVPLVAPAP